MLPIILLISLLYLIFSSIAEVVILQKKYNIDFPMYSPIVLYENTKMNWFGCWFCFIVIRLLAPINTTIGLITTIIYYICNFVEWLFTVGRKDD